MYKLTKPDGFDFYSGRINYRHAIGSIIRVTDYDPPEHGVCGRGLHVSRDPNDCFIGAKIPCAAFRVQGVGRIAGDAQKVRYKAIKVFEEIHDLDALFGWRYSEAANPIHPFKLSFPKTTDREISLLKDWDSVGDSVWDSVGDSVGDFVGDFVWDSMGASVWDSVGASVWDSMGASVWDSVGAYIGSFFPGIKTWKYIDHKLGQYPFQPAVDLWKMGLVPSFDGKTWRLHGGEKGKILWEGTV